MLHNEFSVRMLGCMCWSIVLFVVCLRGSVKIRCPILSGMTFELSRNTHCLIAVKVSFRLFIFHVPSRDLFLFIFL
jgi:hypothetical protein